MRGLFVPILATVVASALPFTATAGNAHAGTISTVTFTANGLVNFMHTGQRTNVPGCVQPALTQRWAFDASTNGGKAMLSGLLAAYTAGKRIGIYGTGACSLWSDTETMSGFHTDD